MQVTREPVALSRATRLLNHGPVTIVTSAHGGRTNVMAASWAMPLDFDPPKVVVVVDSHTQTRRLIGASGVFGLQLPSRAFASQTLAVGTHSGVDLDKFSTFGLETFPAQNIDVPMMSGCIAWLECKVIPDDSQRLDLIIGEVVAAYADTRVYSNNRWHFGDDPDLRTCHYVAGGSFFETGAAFEVTAATSGEAA
ncbi:flavin reductase family protein [Paraburkholderia sp. BCC1884]|uniref:flavin reductase family protein n=1 Tax=Paraburkholderia sp. BCC1884 TaxID=2562668 RepID=UPI0011839DB2|nr:flavin reductase family protein [Paraburkholderia sp. BCC1884]